MKFYSSSLLIFITLALWLSCSCVVEGRVISRQECIDKGGEVVGDIENGAIFQPDYLCAINDEAPSYFVFAQYGEPLFLFATEVCCGGTVDVAISRQECKDKGGVVVGDIGDGAISKPGYLCPTNGEAPSDRVVAQDGENIATEGEVCCGGTVDTAISRQECRDKGGVVVGDIGNGAIHQPDYLCPTNGEAPSDTVFALDGEPIAIEGEVCCGGADGEPTSGGPLFNQQNAISALQAALASLNIFL